VLAIPLLAGFVASTVPLKSVERAVYDPPGYVVAGWAITLVIMSALLLTARGERKRCTECDWSTDDVDDTDDASDTNRPLPP